MHLFWWQQLPLLILIQLLEPNTSNQKIHVEAIFARKITIGGAEYSSEKTPRYPCLIQWASVNCNEVTDRGVVALYALCLFPSSRYSCLRYYELRHPHFLQTGFIKFSSSNFIFSDSPSKLKERLHESSYRRIIASVNEDNSVPTLTPLQPTDDKKPKRIAAVIAGAGAALLVVIIVVLVYVCLMRVKKFMRHGSETASSALSLPHDQARGNASPYAAAQSPLYTQDIRELSISELEHATRNFSQSNIIGEGSFGLVYKGFLIDGSIVAIKRCLQKPVQDFVHEVKRIASGHHRHLVSLVGYCEEKNQQLLAYDYISNGNVGNYLYDSEGLPIGKLDMRQRLSIALGAAKGLQYLHSLDPPILHMRFRTSNVLLGDNFTGKVSDYGLLKLTMENHHAGSSSSIDFFIDPESSSSRNFLEQSDVYSFGVFLLELISGREANGKYMLISGHNLIQEARECSPENFIDKTMGERSRQAARQLMMVALLCVDISTKRPSMSRIVQVIEHIQRREMGYLQAEIGEDITLGSELFK